MAKSHWVEYTHGPSKWHTVKLVYEDDNDDNNDDIDHLESTHLFNAFPSTLSVTMR